MSDARRRKRKRAVEELLSTEKTYVHLLTKLVEHFVQKLRSNTSMLSNEDHKILFPSDIHAILGLNQTFLEDLQKVIEGGKFNNDTTKIGSIIYAFCPHFKMYQNYLNNYSKAAERLAQLRKKSTSSFSIYCDRQREQKCFNHLPLESLIILPIQRMPRYKMLLEEIIKHTQSIHPDLQQLKQALAKISEVNDSINTRMKDFDARIKVQNIENRFNGKITPLVTPSRRYLKQGQLCKIGSKDDQDYVFFLFNDCLLYASQSMIGDKLIFGNLLRFNSKFKIRQTANKTNVHLIENLFEIHSTTESFMVYASTKTEMNDWIQSINDAFTGYMSVRKNLKTNESCNTFAVTLQIPNDFSEKCMVHGCNAQFTFINRRHHCKYCGYIICGKCSSNQLRSRPTDVQLTTEMVRVCDVCYKTNAGTVGVEVLPAKVRHHSTEKALALLGFAVDDPKAKTPSKTSKKREEGIQEELLTLFKKRAKEAADNTDDIKQTEKDDEIGALAMKNTRPTNKGKKRNSAVLDFVKLDIQPKLIALETDNVKLEENVRELKRMNKELKQDVSTLKRSLNDQNHAQKQIVTRLEKQNNELRADHQRLQSLVKTLSNTTDKSKRAEEIQNTKIKTLESHNENLQNELKVKEQEIEALLVKQSGLQNALQKHEMSMNEDDGKDVTSTPSNITVPRTILSTGNPEVPSPNTQYNNAIQELMHPGVEDTTVNKTVNRQEAKRICSTCNKEIVGRALRTKGGLHHRKCHVCSECKATLAGKLYGVVESNGKKVKLCEVCTNKANEKRVEKSKTSQKRTMRSKNNLYQQMNQFRSTANKVPKPWETETSKSPTLKPSLVRTVSNEDSTSGMKKKQTTSYKVKGSNLKPKKKNARASTLTPQRKCGKCKAVVFGKNRIEGPNNTVFHPNCFRCSDCDNELVQKKWRSYPVKGKTTLTLCPDCARKRDEALFSQHRGKLVL
eukprot:381599_1